MDLHGEVSIAKFQYDRTGHGFWQRKHVLCLIKCQLVISGGSTVESQIHPMNHLSKPAIFAWGNNGFSIDLSMFTNSLPLFTWDSVPSTSKHPIR